MFCFLWMKWSVGIFCLRIPLFVYRVLEELCWCHVLPSFALFVFLKSILFLGETCKNVQKIQYSKNIQRKLRRLSGLIWRRELIWFRVASKHPQGIGFFILFVHIQHLKYHHSEFAMRMWKAKKVYLNPKKGFFWMVIWTSANMWRGVAMAVAGWQTGALDLLMRVGCSTNSH